MGKFLALFLLAPILLSACEVAEFELWDFGDAPDPEFPSLLASDGLRTRDPSQFWLGSLEVPGGTLESEAKITDGDEQDDGLVGVLAYKPGVISLTFQVAKSELARPGVVYFNVWADTNNDGRWQNFIANPSVSAIPVEEWIVQNQTISLAPGETAQIEVDVLNAEGNLEHWVRASVTDTPVSAVEPYVTGRYQMGEVEDHHFIPPYTPPTPTPSPTMTITPTSTPKIGGPVFGVDCDPATLGMFHGEAEEIVLEDVEDAGEVTEFKISNIIGDGQLQRMVKKQTGQVL